MPNFRAAQFPVLRNSLRHAIPCAISHALIHFSSFKNECSSSVKQSEVHRMTGIP